MTGDYLSLFLMKSGFSSSLDLFVYSLQKDILYSWGRIQTDSSSYFLPATSWGIQAISQGKIYSVIPSYLMFQAKGQLEMKLWEKDSVLNKYFTTQDRKSNPVIVEFKLKEGL